MRNAMLGRLSTIFVTVIGIYLSGCSGSKPANRPNVGRPRPGATYVSAPNTLKKSLGKGYVRWDFMPDGSVAVAAFDRSSKNAVTAVAYGHWSNQLQAQNETQEQASLDPVASNSRPSSVQQANVLEGIPQIEVNCQRVSFFDETGDSPKEIFSLVSSGLASSREEPPKKVMDFIEASEVVKDQFPLAECSGRPITLDREGEFLVVREQSDLSLLPIQSEKFNELRQEIPKGIGSYKLSRTADKEKFRNSLVVEDRANDFFPLKTNLLLAKVDLEKDSKLENSVTLTQDISVESRPSSQRRQTRPASETNWQVVLPKSVEFTAQLSGARRLGKSVEIKEKGDLEAAKKIFELELPSGEAYTLRIVSNYLLASGDKLQTGFKVDVDEDNQVTKVYPYSIDEKLPTTW
jgi:hypothetical protein